MCYLRIEGRFDGYTFGECAATMTIGELIEYLKEFDENLPVYINHQDGTYFGSVSEDTCYIDYDVDSDVDEDFD